MKESSRYYFIFVSVSLCLLAEVQWMSSQKSDGPTADYPKGCEYLKCEKGDRCLNRKFWCKHPPCPSMLYCSKSRKESLKGPSTCDTVHCSKGYVCVIRVRRCRWDQIAYRSISYESRIVTSVNRRLSTVCEQRIARCVSKIEYHEGPASCAGFQCPKGSHCVLRESLCINPPCKLLRSCGRDEDVQLWFASCKNLGCPSEYECFLRRPSGNCSNPPCRHSPDCVSTTEDELTNEYCRGWICPREQICSAETIGFCEGDDCEIERSCQGTLVGQTKKTLTQIENELIIRDREEYGKTMQSTTFSPRKEIQSNHPTVLHHNFDENSLKSSNETVSRTKFEEQTARFKSENKRIGNGNKLSHSGIYQQTIDEADRLKIGKQREDSFRLTPAAYELFLKAFADSLRYSFGNSLWHRDASKWRDSLNRLINFSNRSDAEKNMQKLKGPLEKYSSWQKLNYWMKRRLESDSSDEETEDDLYLENAARPGNLGFLQPYRMLLPPHKTLENLRDVDYPFLVGNVIKNPLYRAPPEPFPHLRLPEKFRDLKTAMYLPPPLSSEDLSRRDLQDYFRLNKMYDILRKMAKEKRRDEDKRLKAGKDRDGEKRVQTVSDYEWNPRVSYTTKDNELSRTNLGNVHRNIEDSTARAVIKESNQNPILPKKTLPARFHQGFDVKNRTDFHRDYADYDFDDFIGDPFVIPRFSSLSPTRNNLQSVLNKPTGTRSRPAIQNYDWDPDSKIRGDANTAVRQPSNEISQGQRTDSSNGEPTTRLNPSTELSLKPEIKSHEITDGSNSKRKPSSYNTKSQYHNVINLAGTPFDLPPDDYPDRHDAKYDTRYTLANNGNQKDPTEAPKLYGDVEQIATQDRGNRRTTVVYRDERPSVLRSTYDARPYDVLNDQRDGDYEYYDTVNETDYDNGLLKGNDYDRSY